jgi:DNA-binding NarL/FixJ family response regulator
LDNVIAPKVTVEVVTLSVLHAETDFAWQDVVDRELGKLDFIKRCGTCRTWSRASELCASIRPDILLLDLSLPGGDPRSAIRSLERSFPKMKTVILTNRCDDVSLHLIDELGLKRYLWKTPRFAEQLVDAITASANDSTYYPPEVTAARAAFRQSSKSYFKILSKTEQDLLPFFGNGDSDELIAEELGLKVLTVRWHRRRILARLGLHRSIDLIQWTHKTGFARDELPSPPCILS